MPYCVRVVPGGSVIGMTAGNMVSSTNPMVLEDSSCTSGLKLFTEAEIAALVPSSPGSGSGSASGPDPERMADMQSLFYAFLLVLVLAWGAKQLLNLFSGDTSRD